jgi:hypothetical protein
MTQAQAMQRTSMHATSHGLSALMLIIFRVTRWNASWFRRIGSQPMPPDNRE